MKNLKNIIASIILVAISFVSYTQDILKYEFYLTDSVTVDTTFSVTNTVTNAYTNISEDTLDFGVLNSNMVFTANDTTYQIFLFNEGQYNEYTTGANITTKEVRDNSYDWDIGETGDWSVVVYKSIDSLIPHLIKDTTIFYILIETAGMGNNKKMLNTKIKYSVAKEVEEEEDSTTSIDTDVIGFSNSFIELDTIDAGDSTASIDTEVIEVSNTRVYPNPVINSLNIEFETINTDTKVEIYSTNGQLMYKDVEYRNFGVNKVSVDMSNYPKGMYIVRLGNEVKKVIKR